MSWITLALLMVPLIGHLRAAPLATPQRLSMEALGFEFLNEITCEKDLNLTSPKNVEDKCYNAALGHYIKEFQRTIGSCTEAEDIEMTLEELKRIYSNYSKTQTACTLTMKTHATFEGFVKATEAFAQQYNDS